MRTLSWMILALLSSLAFGQANTAVLGGSGKIGGSGVIGANPLTGPALVQGATNAVLTGTTIAVTVSAVGAGHGLFVFCIATASLCTTPTATGETFNTYTGASGCQNFTGDNTQCWLATGTAGGETSVSCNASSGTIICGVIEFTRPQGLSTPKDAGGNSEVASGTSYTVSTSATTTTTNDFVIGCFASFGTGTNPITMTGGFTAAFTAYGTSLGNMSCGYLVASSTGTQTATGTAVTSMRATGVILAVKP